MAAVDDISIHTITKDCTAKRIENTAVSLTRMSLSMLKEGLPLRNCVQVEMQSPTKYREKGRPHVKFTRQR